MKCPVCNNHSEIYHLRCTCGYRFKEEDVLAARTASKEDLTIRADEKKYYVIRRNGDWQCGCGISNDAGKEVCQGCDNYIGPIDRELWIGFHLSQSPITIRPVATPVVKLRTRAQTVYNNQYIRIDDRGLSLTQTSDLIAWGDIERVYLKNIWITPFLRWKFIIIDRKSVPGSDPPQLEINFRFVVARINGVVAIEPEAVLEVMLYKLSSVT